MRIIKPEFNKIYNENPQKHIESIARTCYKSNDLITEDSHKKFIRNLYNRKHWAMLEHFIFVYQCKTPFFEILCSEKFINCTRTLIDVPAPDGFVKQYVRYIISFNARSILDMLERYKDESYIRENLIELCEQVVADYDCDELFGNKFKKTIRNDYIKIDDISILTPEEQWMHGWHSVKFICDRGVTHEIVRHRDASFAQESTRYCNYSKDKYGQEITVIKPCYLNDGSEDLNNEMVAYGVWKRAMEESEKAYFKMLDLGYTAQEARAVLPNSLKTELIMTARNYEWEHFFELRCDKCAHPQMREVAKVLFEQFSKDDNVLFNRNNVKFID